MFRKRAILPEVPTAAPCGFGVDMSATYPGSVRTNGVPVPQLARLRKRAGLSQQALANRAELSMQTISRLERGANARYMTIALLAKALRVPPARLIEPPSQGQREAEP